MRNQHTSLLQIIRHAVVILKSVAMESFCFAVIDLRLMGKTLLNDLGQGKGLGNCSLWAKCSPTSAFASKVLLREAH